MSLETGLQLADFAVNAHFDAFPEEVVGYAKGLTLKMVAGMFAGSIKPSSIKLAEVAKAHSLAGEATVAGWDFKTSLWDAAFLNTFFAHASELEDDTFSGGGVAWNLTVIPALISVAEKRKLSGRALLEAIIVGLEIQCRTCLFPSDHLDLLVIPGAVGPAAGVGRALGLGRSEMANALGLAKSGVPLALSSLGTDAHYLESALMSLQGVMAADLAKAGMTGNPDIGSFLIKFLGEQKVAEEKMVEGLGRRWHLQDIWIKKYPCCLFTHRPIDAVIELRKEHGLSYDDVEVVEVHISQIEDVCDRPNPMTDGDLQFSFQHTLGTALLLGDVGLEHIVPAAVTDPRLMAARSKVRVVIHPDWPSGMMAVPVRVVVKLKDGRELSRERQSTIGSPSDPLSQEQFSGLYSKFTRHVLTEAEISRTAELVMNMEQLTDIGELVDILRIVRTR